MTAKNLDLTITKGETYIHELRWEIDPIIYKAVTAVVGTAPLRLTVVGHGMKDGWRAALTNFKGMTEVNAEANAIRERDYHEATVIGVDTVEFNDINAAGFKAYTSGGILQYNSAVSLVGVDLRMSIKDKVGGTELLRLDIDNGRILVDEELNKFTLLISAVDTAAIEWKKGVYDLEAQATSGVVTKLFVGEVAVASEITTT